MISTCQLPPSEVSNCQLCEKNPNKAIIFCEQCDIFYCSNCRDLLHPPRGPLIKHTLIPAINKSSSPTLNDTSNYCQNHDQELSMYCSECRQYLCCRCLHEGHTNHQVDSLSTTVKANKNELSQTLTSLSEKAKIATDDISKLKQCHEMVNQSCEELKKKIDIQFNDLMQMLDQKKQSLYQIVEKERKHRRAHLKDQIGKCTSHLSKTTSLIQFCIEILKESDALDFMQISERISNRAANHEFMWDKEMRAKLEIDANIILNLNVKTTESAINGLNFTQKKVPNTPEFYPNECSAENNSVTIVWGLKDDSIGINGYILEICQVDKDRKERFREVYRGPESICSIYGLHFDSYYKARVKAYNLTGSSVESEYITLQTAPYAFFQFEQNDLKQDIVLSSNLMSVAGTSLDYKVVLGNVYFSKGIHYWEIVIDSLRTNADIVVGISLEKVNRNAMLGKDGLGWSIYADGERSWFLHGDNHHGRSNYGIEKGSVIGLLLNCDKGTLTFFMNKKPLVVDNCQFAFKNLPKQIFYPAVSVNFNSQVTFKTGIAPPKYAIEMMESAL
uniref:B30.2/SPRY domain-containing protein n=1 Tax=Rhabditophanes sp. KR3021 TaxID=114890 RepID=A0AC35UI54_9BILA